MILINIKINTHLLCIGLEDHAHTSRSWTSNLIGRDILDDLHHFYDPITEFRLIGKIGNLERDIEIGFHRDEGSCPILTDTVLAKGERAGLCFGLQSLYRDEELAG